MPDRLQKNSPFLTLLITTNRVQAIAILETVDSNQTDCISEVILNFSQGNLIYLSKHVRLILYKHRKIIQTLKDRGIANSKRMNTIKSHPKIILSILKEVGKKIRKLCLNQ